MAVLPAASPARPWRLACCAVGVVIGSLGLSGPAAAQSRGELLYATHCIACHTEQVHWRQKRLATDWTGLKAQVWRWQAEVGLGWGEADVAEVARYLNEEFYRFPDATVPAGRGGYASRWESPKPTPAPGSPSPAQGGREDRRPPARPSP